MTDQEDAGLLHEECRDCEWETKWSGGTSAEDPAVDHALETGHTVHTEVADER